VIADPIKPAPPVTRYFFTLIIKSARMMPPSKIPD
jgi:hypothetical protein